MTDRLTSTGRTPALAPKDVERMLGRYFAEDKPSLSTLAEEFTRTDKSGKAHPLSLASIRKYLKAAGIKLPRGRANDLPRVPQRLQTLMNRIPTETLIGQGRAILLARRLERGEGVVALAREFGVSKDRVRRLRERVAPWAASEEVPAIEEVVESVEAESVEAAAADEAAPEEEVAEVASEEEVVPEGEAEVIAD